MFRLCSCCTKESVAVQDVVTDVATKKKNYMVPWRYRLFGRPLSKQFKEKNQSITTSDNKASQEKAKKPRWWHYLKNRGRISPISEEDLLEEEEEEEEQQQQKRLPQALFEEEEEAAIITSKTPRQQLVKCFGFPNPAQICYMNSCLQSLLTLEDFVRDFGSQEHVWGLVPEAELMRSFMDISRSHYSGDVRQKICLLAAFKKAVSLWAPEFRDLHQKDAHEFLTSVLDQMRCLGSQLQVLATSMGGTYSCPVEHHLVFNMQNTRTCKRCGSGSTREEQFTNLSLDLAPGGGTVEDMLDNYLRETDLEYNCECGATTSGQRSSFATLPRVLVLHLKRFRFTSSFQLEKVHDPIVLLRELVVPSKQGGGCYSLISTISHIGHTAMSGHYICDGVDPDVGQENTIDRWFTYNDAVVTESSGASVCDQRQRSSYILFYKRQV